MPVGRDIAFTDLPENIAPADDEADAQPA